LLRDHPCEPIGPRDRAMDKNKGRKKRTQGPAIGGSY